VGTHRYAHTTCAYTYTWLHTYTDIPHAHTDIDASYTCVPPHPHKTTCQGFTQMKCSQLPILSFQPGGCASVDSAGDSGSRKPGFLFPLSGFTRQAVPKFSFSRNCSASPSQPPASTPTPGLVPLGGITGPVRSCCVLCLSLNSRAEEPHHHPATYSVGTQVWGGSDMTWRPSQPSLTQHPQSGGASGVISEAHPKLQGWQSP
jgi:hypothetical protein